jgi:hypothetical protein
MLEDHCKACGKNLGHSRHVLCFLCRKAKCVDCGGPISSGKKICGDCKRARQGISDGAASYESGVDAWVE